MAATQVATVRVEGLHDQAGAGAEQLITILFRDLAGAPINSPGYASPNLQTLRIRHNADLKMIKGQKGLTTGLMLNDEVIECDFDFIMESTTRTLARAAGRLPDPGAPIDITHAPVIQLGWLADSLNNTTAGNSYPWIYLGGGSINGASDNYWSGVLPLRRFRGIPTWSCVT